MNTLTTEMTRMERLAAAEEIVASLPEPNYRANYQPIYSDTDQLIDAVAETVSTGGVTTPRQAEEFKDALAHMGQDDETALVITSGCRETIHVDTDISLLGRQALLEHKLLYSSRLRKVVAASRNRGQYKKPRSEEIEIIDGKRVVSYMGDVVNGEDPSDREPDPSRIVAGAVQARDLETELAKRAGKHVFAAHEALLLPYEMAFIRRDAKTGLKYSESADLLWAGLRTNQIDSPVIDLLSGIENAVGVKIGGNSDSEHIAGLAERLNPDNRAGKLVFMLRLTLEEIDKYPVILEAIDEHAPNSQKIFDIHGMTRKKEDGTKIRNVNEIISGMTVMARACKKAGVRFDGVHLETTPDPARLECVDNDFQLPTHPGGIDPQLNPQQTLRVLNALADIKQAA